LIVAGSIILNSAVAVAEPGDQVPPDGGCDSDDRSCILRTLKEAYAHDPAPPLLLELARAYEGAGRKGAALTSYLEYQGTCNEEDCLDITARVDELRPHVAELDLELMGLVSKITLDGEVVARGNVEAPLFIDPGEHALEVTWSNGRVDTQRVTVVAGATLSVRLQGGPEPRTVAIYGAPSSPGGGRGCGCGVPGAPSASSPGSDDQGGSPLGFGVLAGAAAAAIALRRRRAAEQLQPALDKAHGDGEKGRMLERPASLLWRHDRDAAMRTQQSAHELNPHTPLPPTGSQPSRGATATDSLVPEVEDRIHCILKNLEVLVRDLAGMDPQDESQAERSSRKHELGQEQLLGRYTQKLGKRRRT
jgi:hypothetical protein